MLDLYDEISNILSIKSNILDTDNSYEFIYDKASNLIKKVSYNNLIEKYIYDHMGNITKYSQGLNTEDNTYDIKVNYFISHINSIWNNYPV